MKLTKLFTLLVSYWFSSFLLVRKSNQIHTDDKVTNCRLELLVEAKVGKGKIMISGVDPN